MKTIVYNVNDTHWMATTPLFPWRHAPLIVFTDGQSLARQFRNRSRHDDDLHAYTGTQSLVDGPRGKDLRLHVQRQKISFPTLQVRQKPLSGDPGTERQTERSCATRAGETGSVTELVSILGKKVTAEE